MNGRRRFTKLAAVALMASLAFLASCDEDQPTDPTAIATDATAAARGGNGNGGGKGGGGGGSSSPADPVITFSTEFGVAVMNRDGSNQTLVAEVPGGVYSPAWAPGGTGTIADPYRIMYSNGSSELTITDVAIVGGAPQGVGSISHPLPNSRCCGAWSPLGDEIAFRDHELEAILIMQVDDGSWRTVYQAPPNRSPGTPEWSPYGQYLVFHETDRTDLTGLTKAIKVLNMADGTAVAIDLGTDVNRLVTPDWARTRNAIAFGARQVKGKKWSHIYIVELEPNGNGNFQSAGLPVRLTKGGLPSWSPDDSEILFSNNSLKIYTIATAFTLNLGVGHAADWRR